MARKGKPWKGNKTLIFSVVVVFVSLLLVAASMAFTFFINKPLDEISYNARVNITDTSGFDLGEEAFTFGNIVPGSNSRRSAIFLNSYDRPVGVDISVSGPIKKYIVFEKDIVVYPGEERKISLTAIAPLSEEDFGFYDGTVKFTVRRSFE